MKLCLVSQEYPPETAKGGIGTQTFVKARGMAARGHEVHVVSRSRDAHPSDTLRDGIHVVRVPSGVPGFPVYTMVADWLTHSVRVAEAVARLHQECALDLVEFPEWAAEGFTHFVNRSPWNALASVVQIHGSLVTHADELGWPEKDSEDYRTGIMLEGTCLRLADRVSTSSRYSADACARAYGLDSSAIPVLHTGVDTSTFRPGLAPKPERPTVIFVGRIVRAKGIDVLLEAVLRAAPEVPGIVLRVLGRGEEELVRALRARATEAGLGDLLRLEGFVPREDLPRELALAHVFAMPSILEPGPGLVYLEAMACGLPVIATTAGGAGEIASDGVEGILVPPRDVAALSQALVRLLKDRGRAEVLGERARSRVVASVDTQQCLDRIETFYKTTVEDFASRRREGS